MPVLHSSCFIQKYRCYSSCQWVSNTTQICHFSAWPIIHIWGGGGTYMCLTQWYQVLWWQIDLILTIISRLIPIMYVCTAFPILHADVKLQCWKAAMRMGLGGRDDGMLRLVLSGEVPWKWCIYLTTKRVIHSLSVLKNSRRAKPLVYIMGCVLSKGWRLLKNSIPYLKVTIVCSGALCSVLASCSICAFSRHWYTWLS